MRFSITATVVSALVMLTSMSVAPPCHSVPLQIRARTQLVRLRIAQNGSQYRLKGSLLDDAGRQVTGKTVTVVLPGSPPITTQSTADGIDVPLPSSAVEAARGLNNETMNWSVHFGGDPAYGPAQAQGRGDLRRQASWLTLDVTPTQADLATEVVTLTVTAQADSGPLSDVPIRIRVADGPELFGETSEAGKAIFLVRPALLGPPGRYFISARLEGDHVFSSSHAEGVLEIVPNVRVSMRVGREGEPRTGRYRFSGRVIDEDGPVREAPVGITLGQPVGKLGPPDGQTKLLAVTRTDKNGVYITAVNARLLFQGRAGQVTVSAVTRPTGSHAAIARSPALTLDVPGAPGVPVRWYVFGLAWVFSLLTVIQMVRKRVFQQIMARFKAWKRRNADPNILAVEEVAFVVSEAPTDAAGRPHWISGQIVDNHGHQAIPGTAIRLTHAAASVPKTCVTDEDGQFSFGPLEPGLWNIEVTAHEYLPRKKVIEVPHGGRLDGATFGLISFKQHSRQVFDRELRQAGGQWRWGYDTAREAIATVAETVRPPLEKSLESLETRWYADQMVEDDGPSTEGMT